MVLFGDLRRSSLLEPSGRDRDLVSGTGFTSSYEIYSLTTVG